MKMILLKNGETISDELLNAVRDATLDNIEYQQEIISSHPERAEQKTGYRPVRINGVIIPFFLLVTFVMGEVEVKAENYFYVVNQFLKTEYEVAGAEEAKLSVLFEMRRIIDDQLLS